jgi:hypothetical protein
MECPIRPETGDLRSYLSWSLRLPGVRLLEATAVLAASQPHAEDRTDAQARPCDSSAVAIDCGEMSEKHRQSYQCLQRGREV